MDQRNIFLAIALSLLILIGSQTLMEYFFPTPPKGPETSQTQAGQPGTPQPGAPNAPSGVPVVPGTAMPTVPPAVQRAEKLQEAPRVPIDTARLSGSIALRGGRIDDLVVRNYRVSVEKDSANEVRFSPSGTQFGFYAQFGWVASSSNIVLPND